ncbi:MAG: HEPN domain-containing protein [Deltaproteobacteria bacterium]|nr:HEPN domain-containing protein [Candidatus Tharpellaceae bacterium]
MEKEDKIKYWLKSADQDWGVAKHLFEKKDYAYALFFGHLTVEKILKAIFTDQHDKTPPFSHNLVYLSEKAGLELNEEMLELLEEVSDFNLEARYPDQKFSFHKKCTMSFTKKKIYEIERVKKWLIQKLSSSI